MIQLTHYPRGSSQICFNHTGTYKRDWLDKQAGKSGKKKGGELSHVVKRLAEGEAGGKRVYSTDFPKKYNWDGVDYQAALLHKPVSVNRADINGALFGKQHPLSEFQRRMWLAVNRRTWKLASSRVTRCSKEETVSNSDDPPAATDAALTEPAPIIDKHRGLTRVIWENICRPESRFLTTIYYCL